ncbi:MFS transporter [Fructobacillus sp. M1-13]|uniref:Multidrug efflux MFS transporter n=1 Tax=Fructobacillus papyriferae TaxID=2713171 RepID=A0ABS5QQE0_9LACO|nr:MFS transporter [Fructobacillus papyriferae]MBS9335152.1 multidrug efflux MFS transporter [Fructobacillus papyriferae]MCD2159178.1 MFS transporter [Fructobacillus papyriferae]
MKEATLKRAALVVAAALFMQMLDSTIVTTALPQIAFDLSVSQSSASLLVSVYMLFAAIFIPLSGWLAKKMSRKTLFLIAVIVFTISSVAVGLVDNLTYILIMRAIQGMAGAMMIPVGKLIILENVASKNLLQILSFLIWPALIAPAIAPLLGGWVVSALSWHWIFFLNFPIGLSILIAGYFLIHDENRKENVSFDWLGFLEVAVAAGLILISAELLSRGLQYLLVGGIMLLLGLLMSVLAFFHLSKADEPLFSLNALSIKSFRIYQTGGSIFWMTIGALPYLLTLLLQVPFHWSAIEAGTYVIFIFLGNLAIKPFTTPIIRFMGYKYALALALGLATMSTFLMAAFNMETVKVWIATVAFVSGVGRSLALTSYNSLAFAELSKEEKNAANTLQSVMQMLSQAFGVGFVATLVALFSQVVVISLAYQLTLFLVGLLSLYPLFEVLTLPKNVGEKTL